MATKIEWTKSADGSQGETWNPVRGCSRVSPGCDNCYAMKQAHRFNTQSPESPYHGLTLLRPKTSSRPGVDWSGVARFVPGHLDVPLKRKKPTTYFVNSMSDLFHHTVTDEQIAAVFGVMAACPQHVFQVLTKRPERAVTWFDWIRRNPVSLGGPTVNAARGVKWYAWNRIDTISVYDADLPWVWPLPNVHLGVSAENQETADERIPLLLQCPAAVRWVSAEPLLGPIDFRLMSRAYGFPKHITRDGRAIGMPQGLHWIVVGGESGNGARPFDLAHARSIRDQCKAAGVPFFFKQAGAHVVDSDRLMGVYAPEDKRSIAYAKALGRSDNPPHLVLLKHRKGADPSEWSEDLRVREMPGWEE